ncbi:transglutaminase TgpA family protein [Haloarcula nitratireducens]|uniref:transglutaminase TgpA family protein n=1 Tax=Haloarcula nitratireducens TaxID=2487749 RepID=UPI002E28EE72|nr:transglutaminaseTgpA domain-containing protein [Halomicroarcula nitratireducens]
MSGVTGRLRGALPWSETRVLALLAVALALGAPLRTMYHLIDVVGDPTLFLAVSAVSLAAAALLARFLPPVVALVIGVVLFAAGLVWYITNLTTDPAIADLLRDTAALLSGRRLLQIANVRLWVISFAPAPVFLATYFALRRWYVTAVMAAGTTLTFFVLTTDAGVVTTLLGVVGGFAAIGFGNLDTLSPPDETIPPASSDTASATGGDAAEGDAGVDSGRRAVLEQLAAIIVLPTILSRAPSVSGSALSFTDESGTTVEGSLLDADESLTVQGDISLTPTVRFTVESEEPRYWRVAAYDRYTGDGWVRTGNASPYGGNRLTGPPGDSRPLRQSYEAESAISTVPAAWKPIRYDGEIDVELTTHRGFQPIEQLTAGDSYEVTSEVVVATPRQLRDAGEDYPDRITQRYLQLPDSTPDRVRETTTTLTANAENPYETALVVERWLQNEREYSLEVDKPDYSVADRFLHEMDRGYCVYFATTMVVMLRTQGIPARFAVGYTSGEQVDENRWVVRGLNSHAWVEAYFPDHGWIQFDPTPSGPRESARQNRIEEARSDGDDSADTDETGGESGFTPTPTATPPPLTETPEENETPTPTPNGTDDAGDTPTPRDRSGGGTDGGDGGTTLPELPSREEAALGLVALLGTAAGLRRAGVTDRVSRAIWLRYQRREDPETDVERAFQRVMAVLADEHRPRERGETVRAYLDAIDAGAEARRIATLRERLRYGGDVSEAAADEAVEIADSVVENR